MGHVSCRDELSRFFCVDVTGTCRCTPSFRCDDANGKEIDIVRSFSPRGILPIVWKLAVWAVEFYTFAIHENGGGFYFAYATNWALVLATFYSCFSLVNSIIPVSQPINAESRVGVRTQTTWILFLLAGNSQLLVTILFWTLLYKGGVPTATAVLSHAGVCALVWIDGFIVNRIPVRARHWLEISIWYVLLYLVWTIIHSAMVADVGNPNIDGDLIYPVLDWGDGSEVPTDAIVISVLCIFVLSPAIHIVMVGVSRCGRVYLNKDSSEDIGGNEKQESAVAVKSGSDDQDIPASINIMTSPEQETSAMVQIYG
jgi:hypothetical protein